MPYFPKSKRARVAIGRADVHRKPPDPRYLTPRWLAVAADVRERDEWLCQACLREGGLAMAMETLMNRPMNSDGQTGRALPVDHKKPAHCCTDAEFYDQKNLETSCERHNKLKSVEDAKRYGVARR